MGYIQGTRFQHQMLCRAAELQYHQKVKKRFGAVSYRKWSIETQTAVRTRRPFRHIHINVRKVQLETHEEIRRSLEHEVPL